MSSLKEGIDGNIPATKWNFLSLGAGVQSSTLALMAAAGEVGPMPDAAIFADTHAEPASVYRWLDWLEKQLPFPVHRVSRGDLSKESLIIRKKKDGSGSWSKSLIPAFVASPGRFVRAVDEDTGEPMSNEDGTPLMIWKAPSKGIMGRQCTYDFKVKQLERAARRLAEIKRGQKVVTVTQWIGISWDEIVRMKLSRVPWSQHRWPLIEKRLTRRHCIEWIESQGFPKPPRSACIYCPYHSDAEWRRLRDDEPAEFAKAIQFEKDIQAVKARTDKMRGIPFLHPSLKPLGEVDLSTDLDRGQVALDFGDEQSFGNECQGMCGI